jgi:hypothetical protein
MQWLAVKAVRDRHSSSATPAACLQRTSRPDGHHSLPGQQPSGYYIAAVPKKTGDDFTMLVMYRPRSGAPMQVDW